MVLNLRFEETQGEEGRRESARDCDTLAGEAVRPDGFAGDDNRTIVSPHAGAAGKKRVLVRHVGIGMEGNRRDLVFAFEGFPVQGFDIAKHVDVIEIAGIDLARGQRVEHECVVGVGTVRNVNVLLHGH